MRHYKCALVGMHYLQVIVIIMNLADVSVSYSHCMFVNACLYKCVLWWYALFAGNSGHHQARRCVGELLRNCRHLLLVWLVAPRAEVTWQHCNNTATHCNTLQHTATHCNTLQHTPTHCSTLQHTMICNTLWLVVPRAQVTWQHCNNTATHCNTFQHTPTHCSTLQHTLICNTLWLVLPCAQVTWQHCNTLQHTATHCNTLQHTATRWSIL